MAARLGEATLGDGPLRRLGLGLGPGLGLGLELGLGLGLGLGLRFGGQGLACSIQVSSSSSRMVISHGGGTPPSPGAPGARMYSPG